MKPLYFGADGERLFGVYSPPSSIGWRDRGVVLCYPFAGEYVRSHRAFLQLTELLNNAGFPVLRFDYIGTGDSECEIGDVTLSSWIKNIEFSIDEIKRLSGARKVVLIGLRLGAALACLVERPERDVSEIVLWDPIVDGKSYLSDLVSVHEREIPDSRESNSTHTELVGFSFSNTLLAELKDLDLSSRSDFPSRKVFFIVSSEQADYSKLRNQFDEININYRYCNVEYSWNWKKLESPLLRPMSILNGITKHLSKEQM